MKPLRINIIRDRKDYNICYKHNVNDKIWKEYTKKSKNIKQYNILESLFCADLSTQRMRHTHDTKTQRDRVWWQWNHEKMLDLTKSTSFPLDAHNKNHQPTRFVRIFNTRSCCSKNLSRLAFTKGRQRIPWRWRTVTTAVEDHELSSSPWK